MVEMNALWQKYQNVVVMGGIALGAFLLRIQGIDFGLPWIHTISDEVVIAEYALKMGTGDLNPHFFLWPANLHMYLMLGLYGIYFAIGKALGLFASVQDFALAYWVNPSSFYLIGRYFSAIIGTATVVLVYVIGKREWGTRVGWLSALFLSIIFEHARLSHVMKVDILFTGLIVLAFFWIMNLLKYGRTRDYVLAGLLTGLGIAAKYVAGLMVVPIFVAHILYRRSQEKFRFAWIIDKNLIGAAVAVWGGFFSGCPYFFLSPEESLTWLQTMIRYGKTGLLGNDYYGPVWSYMFTDVLYHGLGPAIFVLAVVGMAYALYTHTRPLSVLLLVPVLYIFQVSQLQILQLRHILPALPFLAILSAIGFEALTRNLLRRIRRKTVWIGVALAGVVAVSGYGIVQYNLLVFTAKDSRVFAKEWIEANIPAGSKIARDVYWTSPPLAENKQSLTRAYDLITHADPGHGSRYQMRLAVPDNLFPAISYDLVDVFSIAGYAKQTPAEYLRANAFDYAVISSAYYDRFYDDAALAYHAKEIIKGRDFYTTLQERGTLIATFEPDARVQRKYAHRRYLGLPPTIKVYRMNQ